MRSGLGNGNSAAAGAGCALWRGDMSAKSAKRNRKDLRVLCKPSGGRTIFVEPGSGPVDWDTQSKWCVSIWSPVVIRDLAVEEGRKGL